MKLTLAALALTLNEVSAATVVIDPSPIAPVCANEDDKRCPADQGLTCQSMTVTAKDDTAITYGFIATGVFQLDDATFAV